MEVCSSRSGGVDEYRLHAESDDERERRNGGLRDEPRRARGVRRNAALLRPERLVGIDVDAAAFAVAARSGAEVLRADVRELPFEDGSFDLVFDFGTCRRLGRLQRPPVGRARIRAPAADPGRGLRLPAEAPRGGGSDSERLVRLVGFLVALAPGGLGLCDGLVAASLDPPAALALRVAATLGELVSLCAVELTLRVAGTRARRAEA